MIEYRIQPCLPGAHLYRIELLIPEPAADGQVLSMAAWVPGSYMIRDFARHLVTLGASSAGKAVSTSKLDKQTWRCDPVPGPLQIVYEVYAWELSVRAAHLDTSHAYFNGTSVFLRAHGFEEAPCRVELLPPKGPEYADWRVATTLPADGASPFGFGRYRAADYDELIDHPVEMGTFTWTTFTAAGVPHDIVITGRHRADMDRLCRDLAPVCEQHIGLFGELPVQRYLFLVSAVGEGYGGLEHRSSTSLICKRDDLPRSGETKVSNGYRQFLGLCSHEYFHLWNVKRIRPQVLLEQGLEAEVHTRLLWAFEGITSYYDELALLRGGRIGVDSYLELLAQAITRFMRGSGRRKQSLSDASFDAWTRFYKQDENAPNAIVSYYTKGALVALALDLTIRQGPEGKKTLDDLMRALWQRHGKPGRGVAEDDIERLASEVSGLDLRGFFDRTLRTTEDLSLRELLAAFGIELRMRPARDTADRGGIGKGTGAPGGPGPKPVLGARFPGTGREARLTQVLDAGAAQKAGLAAGDLILAVDGIRVRPDNLAQLIAGIPSGESVEVHAFRRDELMRFQVQPKPAPSDTCELRLLDDVAADVLSRRNAWLNL